MKITYTFGIPDHPDSYFHLTFTLAEIEAGDPYEVISDNPMLRDYRILERCLVDSSPEK
jgi:hypothetical protein